MLKIPTHYTRIITLCFVFLSRGPTPVTVVLTTTENVIKRVIIMFDGVINYYHWSTNDSWRRRLIDRISHTTNPNLIKFLHRGFYALKNSNTRTFTFGRVFFFLNIIITIITRAFLLVCSVSIAWFLNRIFFEFGVFLLYTAPFDSCVYRYAVMSYWIFIKTLL